MKFKNPFRTRWAVRENVVFKLEGLWLFKNTFNWNLFDSKDDAEDWLAFHEGKMNQHQAVTYLLSSKRLTTEKAAKNLYYFLEDQEDFNLDLTRFLGNSYPLDLNLSNQLEELFGLDKNYLFNLPAVNIYKEIDKRNEDQ